MPDNAVQGALIALIRALPLIGHALLPPHLMGQPLHDAPRGADPVIIIHGITDSGIGSEDLADSLRRDGFTVFTPTMPESGLDGIAANVEFLRRYVAWVLRATGARHVDMVGHSQGGLSIRAFIRAGGAQYVDSAISINSPHHGVGGVWQGIIDAVRAVPLLRRISPRGLLELDARDPLFHTLNDGDETPGDVRYTSIYSRDFDGIVFPIDSPHLEGARNILLEDPRWFGQARGPHHVLVNHYSAAAFDAVRGALLEGR